jgi:PBSX family phage terminase large subunit
MIRLVKQYKPLFKRPKTRYFLITGGRGSAKSWHITYFLLRLTYQPGHVILFTRWTLTSAHISIIPEFIEKIEILGKEHEFEISKTEITNKLSGSKILFRGIKTSQGTATANLKSISGVTTWVLDEAEELVDDDVFDKIDLSIRSKLHPNRVMLVMNPSYKSHWIYQRFIENDIHPNCTYIHTSYIDNKKNLSDSFIEAAESTKEINEFRYRHLFLGDWIEDKEGLLWNMNLIERLRIPVKPNLKRLIIAIDPAATANMESDETGITVQGIDYNGNGYLLDDLSGKYSPNEWAKVAAQAAANYNADCIVAEKNQGGDMVESVIRQQDKRIRVKLVNATKGKYVRAEPVYSLYEQGKIYHVGNFPILERQMITFDPEKGKSPDRVDALVWGFTELMLLNRRTAFGIS